MGVQLQLINIVKFVIQEYVWVKSTTGYGNRLKYESPEGTWVFKKKAISKSLYRIVQSVRTD